MTESGKSKWFHKLGPKPSSKHQNGIIGLVEHIDFSAILVFRTSKNLKSRKKPISCTGPMIPFWCFELGLEQPWPTRGPRAACGPWSSLMWPSCSLWKTLFWSKIDYIFRKTPNFVPQNDDFSKMWPSSRFGLAMALIFSIRPSDKIFNFSITSSFEHQFPGKQDLIRENGLRIRTQRGQITLGHIVVF
jgi:hypothetical protein